MMASKQMPLPEFARELRGELRINEPMSRHTSWKTGGLADYLYVPADKQDLIHLISVLPEEIDLHWVGLGSNLLVRDGGIRGLVLKTSRGLNEIETCGNQVLYAEAGVSCARVARVSVRNGLGGVEFLAGVPGSFGGALRMNAGAFGGETWNHVMSIECIDRTGNILELTKQEIAHAYRSVELPSGHWILSGKLQLHELASGDNGKQKIRSLLEKRSQSQPIQSANAGSVFRNPQGDFAARLIEQAGLKGMSMGEAVISEVHANFIINRGGATAADIEKLINLVQERVFRYCGTQLQTEVHVVGDSL